MSSVTKISAERWRVALAAQRKCEITLEVLLTREQAKNIVAHQTKLLADPNAPEPDIGTAVMMCLVPSTVGT